jgi:hypothetical protein
LRAKLQLLFQRKLKRKQHANKQTGVISATPVEMLTQKNYVHRHFPTNNWQNWGYFLYEGGGDGILNYAN